ncbi:hypothetical protein [Gemmata sp. SH-PL17]|uniref:hypothetical protein n=1 Tax=Gemmata sp. SH-PL17 TaxID=1630693 RepID=UPI00069794F1|nr:hypothetical protein [Gemmata sp. SH-PL17]
MLAHVEAHVEQRKPGLLVLACFNLIWDELPDVCRDWVIAFGNEIEGRVADQIDDKWLDVLDYFRDQNTPDGERRYALLNLSTGCEMGCWSDDYYPDRGDTVWAQAEAEHADVLRDIFGNPFRPVTLSPSSITSIAVALAAQMYESRDFSAMPILADALQDAGCDNDDILNHCRGPGPHVRGCWVVDLVLGKQ